MATLSAELDKTLMVILRDGKNLVGTLRSFDQFANLMLENTYERIIVGNKYCDIPLGLYLIRGENVLLMGELDLQKDSQQQVLTKTSAEQIFALQAQDGRLPNQLVFDDGVA